MLAGLLLLLRPSKCVTVDGATVATSAAAAAAVGRMMEGRKLEPIPGYTRGFVRLNGHWYADPPSDQAAANEYYTDWARTEGEPLLQLLLAAEEEDHGSIKPDLLKIGEKRQAGAFDVPTHGRIRDIPVTRRLCVRGPG